jgi:hypothetical protein
MSIKTLAAAWGSVGLLVGTSLGLLVPTASAAASDPTAPASTPDSCQPTPSTPISLTMDVDAASWEPMLDALPAVVSPSAEEQAYLSAIDEVHRHVRIDGSRMGMTMIMFSLCELDDALLGSRLTAIGADLDQAAATLAGIAVPDRLGAVHHNYSQVVRLYQQGVAEMDRATQDGNVQHLRDAFPFTKVASDELAELEALVWPPSVPEVVQPSSPSAPVAPH